MKKFLLALIASFGLTSFAQAEPSSPSIVKISVLTSGEAKLNGKLSSLDEIQTAIGVLKESSGEVWYYRESGTDEPPEIATKIIQMIIDAKLPVSLSSKPDFSDYVNEKGESKPRGG
jgi:hypothetical protein